MAPIRMRLGEVDGPAVRFVECSSEGALDAADDQVFYGHVLGFKGLERPAVVLALNEGEPLERRASGCTSASRVPRDQLVVCGDPGFVERWAVPRC